MHNSLFLFPRVIIFTLTLILQPFCDVKIKNRTDVGVKSDYREVKIQTGGTTSLFLQATTQNRIREDFEIDLLYADTIGNLYTQRLRLHDKIMLKAKLM